MEHVVHLIIDLGSTTTRCGRRVNGKAFHRVVSFPGDTNVHSFVHTLLALPKKRDQDELKWGWQVYPLRNVRESERYVVLKSVKFLLLIDKENELPEDAAKELAIARKWGYEREYICEAFVKALIGYLIPKDDIPTKVRIHAAIPSTGDSRPTDSYRKLLEDAVRVTYADIPIDVDIETEGSMALLGISHRMNEKTPVAGKVACADCGGLTMDVCIGTISQMKPFTLTIEGQASFAYGSSAITNAIQQLDKPDIVDAVHNIVNPYKSDFEKMDIRGNGPSFVEPEDWEKLVEKIKEADSETNRQRCKALLEFFNKTLKAYNEDLTIWMIGGASGSETFRRHLDAIFLHTKITTQYFYGQDHDGHENDQPAIRGLEVWASDPSCIQPTLPCDIVVMSHRDKPSGDESEEEEAYEEEQIEIARQGDVPSELSPTRFILRNPRSEAASPLTFTLKLFEVKKGLDRRFLKGRKADRRTISPDDVVQIYEFPPEELDIDARQGVVYLFIQMRSRVLHATIVYRKDGTECATVEGLRTSDIFGDGAEPNRWYRETYALRFNTVKMVLLPQAALETLPGHQSGFGTPLPEAVHVKKWRRVMQNDSGESPNE